MDETVTWLRWLVMAVLLVGFINLIYLRAILKQLKGRNPDPF